MSLENLVKDLVSAQEYQQASIEVLRQRVDSLGLQVAQFKSSADIMVTTLSRIIREP